MILVFGRGQRWGGRHRQGKLEVEENTARKEKGGGGGWMIGGRPVPVASW